MKSLLSFFIGDTALLYRIVESNKKLDGNLPFSCALVQGYSSNAGCTALPDARNSAVSRLFFAGSPTAISRLVVSVVIDPVKSKVGLWYSHVSEKVIKSFPLREDTYSSPSVIWILWTLRLIAALFHVAPNSVYARPFLIHEPCQAVGSGVSKPGLLFEASAASGSSCPEVSPIGYGFFSAIAPAIPEAGLWFVVRHDYQSPETLSRMIYGLVHV